MSNLLVVKKSIEINAPASTVWRVMTHPEMTKQYMFGCEAISDWKVGNSLVWKGSADNKVYVKGTILQIETAKLLQYTTFDPNSSLEDIPENYMTVNCQLSVNDGKTVLSIEQGDFANAENGQKRYRETAAGWDSILPKIKALSEK